MNRKVMMVDRTSIYRIMPISVSPVVPKSAKKYLIRPRIFREPDASVGMLKKGSR